MGLVWRVGPGGALLLASGLFACAPDAMGPIDEGSGGSSAGGSSAFGTGGQESETGSGGQVARPKERTRAARLTHEQYKNTVRDLFQFDEDYTAGFAPDALNGFAFDTSIDFVVDSRLVGQYRTAAETIAERVAADELAVARIMPCDDDSEECRDEFIRSFGRRAFRRPLTETEATRFAELFDSGPDLVGGDDAFVDGIRLTIEAMLVTPSFLYRTELEAEPNDSGRIELTTYELASRLSYFFYGSMPDEELFEAAEEGRLATQAGLAAEIERLVALDRTRDSLTRFHEQAFHFDRYSRIGPDSEEFPNAPEDLKESALAASRLFLRDVMEEGGGLSEILTAPFAYADESLAPLYGVSVEGGFQRVEFPENERAGLLMQVGFLASHAYAKKTDPIHRGLFVVRDLLCQTIPDPPPEAANAKLPPGSPKPKTTREEVDLLTSPDGCSLCHSVINPPGFAFEGFDAVGQTRESEDGTPVLTSGALLIDGEEVAFTGPSELVQALGGSRDADRCYVGKWAQYAHGRELSGSELDFLGAIPVGLSAQDLAIRIASDESFRTRTRSEVSP